MECNIPHKCVKLNITHGKKGNDYHDSQAADEQLLVIDNNFVCPLLTINTDGQIQRNHSCSGFMDYDLKKSGTELTPVFSPSLVKCGRGIQVILLFIK